MVLGQFHKYTTTQAAVSESTDSFAQFYGNSCTHAVLTCPLSNSNQLHEYWIQLNAAHTVTTNLYRHIQQQPRIVSMLDKYQIHISNEYSENVTFLLENMCLNLRYSTVNEAKPIGNNNNNRFIIQVTKYSIRIFSMCWKTGGLVQCKKPK